MNETRVPGLSPTQALPAERILVRRRRWRMTKDAVARHAVTLGGIGVIVAITLIFFYLAYVVIPLFKPASMHATAEYALPGGTVAETAHLSLEEQGEVGVRFTLAGEAVFFRVADGSLVERSRLPLPAGAEVVSFATGSPGSGLVGLGLSNGQALVVRHAYKVTFPQDRRLITPQLEFPLGEEAITVDPQGRALSRLAVQSNEDQTTIVAATEAGRLVMTVVTKERNFLTDELTLESENLALPYPQHGVRYILINPEQRNLYVAGPQGNLTYVDIADPGSPEVVQRLQLLAEGKRLTALEMLAGGFSLLAGDSTGQISQWFPVRDEEGTYTLRRVRSFHQQTAPIVAIAPEYYRKGFLAVDESGVLGIYHTTAAQNVLLKDIADGAVPHVAIGPRADKVLAQNAQGMVGVFEVENEHPEVSISSLWGKVWYEGYSEPKYIWQSSAATETFEPKFSLTPTSFGTLKAAFYAMIFAVPLAIMGAMFTAHFMSPQMRRLVKPTIEIMEALPTVILGFLAGLWLAPFIEAYLPGIFSMLLLMPIGILLFAYIWSRMPARIRASIPDGWEAALLMPAVVLVVWASIAASPLLEEAFFGGNMRSWLTNEMGIDFDQRNSIVVGLAMGFAVIPTIFSIAEDAVFGVPKHLSNGSLALGATPWQTMWRVVLLTASPGIFSAVMIGLGRAVGETMIVLMATGNTPVMDMNIFEGMRTLSANIAVEMPESEVNSTHYRVLFLAGLVLFLFTFFFNTVAEIVRQRLRRKYSSL